MIFQQPPFRFHDIILLKRCAQWRKQERLGVELFAARSITDNKVHCWVGTAGASFRLPRVSGDALLDRFEACYWQSAEMKWP